MRDLKTIKVFRYDEVGNVWTGNEIKNVFVSGTNEQYRLSDTLDKNASCIMRVIGDLLCDVKAGDRIVLTPCEGDMPPKDAMVVVSVTRNEHGKKTAHTKIMCK